MKSIAELCQWLRDNSSGIYRPAAEAATELERLTAELAAARAEMERYKADAARRLSLIERVMDDDDPAVRYTLGRTLCDELRAELTGRAAIDAARQAG